MKKVLYYIEEVKNLIDSIPMEKYNQSLINDFERFSKIFWNYYNHEYNTNNINNKINDMFIVSDVEILKIKLYTIRDQVLEILNE